MPAADGTGGAAPPARGERRRRPLTVCRQDAGPAVQPNLGLGCDRPRRQRPGMALPPKCQLDRLAEAVGHASVGHSTEAAVTPVTNGKSPARTTPPGSPGPSSWRGWARSFLLSARIVGATSGSEETAGRSRLTRSERFASGRRPGCESPREISPSRIWESRWSCPRSTSTASDRRRTRGHHEAARPPASERLRADTGKTPL